ERILSNKEADLDAEQLIGSLIRGAFTGGSRRKRSRGALRFLTGGRNSFLNASTLLTVAGVAWGLYESATEPATTPASTGGSGIPATPQTVPPPPPFPGSPSSESPSLNPAQIPPELIR